MTLLWSMKRANLSILDIGVNTVKHEGNNHDLQTEIHTLAPFEHDRCQKIGNILFSQKIIYQFSNFQNVNSYHSISAFEAMFL